MKKVFIFFMVVLISSCTTSKPPTYIQPPAPNSQLSNSVVIDKTYDEVWAALIETSSKSFFSIKNFEKDSGLLTLSFGSGQTEQYVTCGEIDSPNRNYRGSFISAVSVGTSMVQSSSLLGAMVQPTVNTPTTGYSGLDGAINLFVKRINDNSTQVAVNTRYIFTAKDVAYQEQQWVFDGTNTATKRVGDLMITCRSTLKAENDIISNINMIANSN